MNIQQEVRPSSSHPITPGQAAATIDELQAFDGAPAALAKIAADLAPALATLAARFDTIRELESAAAGSRGAIIADTAEGFAAGRLTVDDVNAAAVSATVAADPRGPVWEICQSAHTKVSRQTVRHLAAVGDRWITDVLRPMVDARVATIVTETGERQAERLAGAAGHWSDWNRETEFAARNPAVVAAFNELARLHDIADEWRNVRAIPAVRREAWTYRYGAATHGRYRMEFTPAVVALSAYLAGKPSIYTETETHENHGKGEPGFRPLPPVPAPEKL